ncbi:MAG: glycosyltransferase family 39 protein [Candidatus Saccharibacteria bacterium]|nr:glycosyltransferase family 39 protein [Candidatus Saccharibacteria bacterium]
MKQWVYKTGRQLSQFFDNKWGVIVSLVVSIGSFLALAIPRLSTVAFWFDESFSSFITRFNWADLTHYTAVDVHPPLYYYLLKIWTSLFGSSVAAMRSMSVFFGVIALVLIFVLIKKLFGRKTAGLATFLIAISPVMVHYGIEARMYTVLLCITIGATIMMIRANKTDKWLDYLVYGFLVALGMWTHYFTAVVWLGHWIYRLISLRVDGIRSKELWRRYFDKKWLVAFVFAIALYLPWMPILLQQFNTVNEGFWIGDVNINTPIGYFADALLFSEGDQSYERSVITNWLAILVLITFITLVVATTKYFVQTAKQSQKRKNLSLIITLATAPVIILILLSLPPFEPLFVSRYLVTSMVFLIILFVINVMWSPKKNRYLKLQLLLAGLIIATTAIGLGRVFHYENNMRGNALAGELVKAVQAKDNETPIVAPDAYSYYVAVANNGVDNIYLSYDSIKDSQVGSVLMTKYAECQQLNSDKKTRSTCTAYAYTEDKRLSFPVLDKQPQQFWLIGSTDDDKIELPDTLSGYHAKETIFITNPATGDHKYKATLYQL